LLLIEIRKLMKQNGVQGYIIPTSDDHRTEYVSEWMKRREFITGFKGSAGYALVTEEEALIWVDGRYHEQVVTEVDCNWTPQKEGLKDTLSISAWVKKKLKGKTIGVDPRVISIANKDSWMKSWKPDITWKNINENLVDKIWKHQPKPSKAKIFRQPLKFSGMRYEKKLDNLRIKMEQQNTMAIIVQALDDVAWLLNLRGGDINFIPFFYGYIIVTKENVSLYVDLDKIKNTSIAGELCQGESKYCVTIKDYNYTLIANDIQSMVASSNEKIWITPDSSVFLSMNIAEDRQFLSASPIQLPKARKNQVEVEGMKSANIKDGIAIMEYFVWLQEQIDAGNYVTEISGADKLRYFKSLQENFVDLSFRTISGFGPNGAIIHYSANNNTDRQITDQSLYLLDSGAQFPEGSTDITRTIHLGTPNEKQKEMFTYVLQGSMNLARAIFPQGTYGRNIDVYARRFLWEKGLDYRHGTGHGIGSFLSIHEGPGRINTGRTSATESALYEGMVFSDEPGYYETGDFGIRLETAIYITEAKSLKYTMEGRSFYKFDILTYVPFARNLINVDLLSQTDVDWLNNYNKECRRIVTPYLKAQGKEKVLNFMLAQTEHIYKDGKSNGASTNRLQMSFIVAILVSVLVTSSSFSL